VVQYWSSANDYDDNILGQGLLNSRSFVPVMLLSCCCSKPICIQVTFLLVTFVLIVTLATLYSDVHLDM